MRLEFLSFGVKKSFDWLATNESRVKMPFRRLMGCDWLATRRADGFARPRVKFSFCFAPLLLQILFKPFLFLMYARVTHFAKVAIFSLIQLLYLRCTAKVRPVY